MDELSYLRTLVWKYVDPMDVEPQDVDFVVHTQRLFREQEEKNSD